MAHILFLFFVIALSRGNELQPNSLKLEQVLILSRHNIRTPLITNLQAYSPKIWPEFKESVGHLTQRGALFENFLAEYITEWLETNDFIKGCPKSEDVLIYANTKPRTIDTAKAFAKTLFGSCDITYSHNNNINVFDPLFLPVYHNNTENFKQKIIEEMKRKLLEINLKPSYLLLNKILDINNSDICKQKSICDLSALQDDIIYIEGEEPDVNGPLSIGTSIVDSFIMSFYEGLPQDNVAWGQIKSDEDWELLTKIIRQNQNVRFNVTLGLKDMTEPLLNYMSNIFRNGQPKLTVLIGHDSNLNPIINALRFKEFTVKNQHEPFPIGGKLVFQKWSNNENSFLKVEYMYPTFTQLRNSVKLSLAQPPEKVLMELKDCKIDNNGFCPWDDFVKLIS